MDYWQRRNLKAQEAVSNKSIKEIEKQLAKYYRATAKRAMRDFEATYDKLLATAAAGQLPTPADLYKLDKYWQMQGQLKHELQRLGDQSIDLLQKAFVKQYIEVYNSLYLPSQAAFASVDRAMALQMINSIWCADGKSWSSRVWKNTDNLIEALNGELIQCVVTGKKTTELKHLLQERFDVNYREADRLVRTEIAHIQTQAAQKRYEDYGIQEVEVWVDEDERTCPICAKHEGERHKISERMPVPFHPNCRCCMIPVIEID